MQSQSPDLQSTDLQSQVLNKQQVIIAARLANMLGYRWGLMYDPTAGEGRGGYKLT